MRNAGILHHGPSCLMEAVMLFTAQSFVSQSKYEPGGVTNTVEQWHRANTDMQLAFCPYFVKYHRQPLYMLLKTEFRSIASVL